MPISIYNSKLVNYKMSPRSLGATFIIPSWFMGPSYGCKTHFSLDVVFYYDNKRFIEEIFGNGKVRR